MLTGYYPYLGDKKMSNNIQNIETPFLDAIKRNTGLTIAAGVVTLLMGVLAIGSPFVAGASLAVMVGILLIIGGISQLVFAFKVGGGLFTIILGVLTVVAGGYMVSNPGAALATLTIFLAIYLIASGILESVVAFQVKPAEGWGMAMFSGILSVLLGLMIWNQFPLSGAWAVGILLGVKLVFSGLTLLMFGIAARGATKELSGMS
jgi:uncharacterized membrane protein HdeD (DUF308 family)